MKMVLFFILFSLLKASCTCFKKTLLSEILRLQCISVLSNILMMHKIRIQKDFCPMD